MRIYIGFSRPTNSISLFGWFIEWVEARPYDHCYVRLPEPMDKEYVIFQASNMQVNLYSLENFKAHHQSLKEYELEITDLQYENLWRFAKSMLGVPYSLKEDFGILLMKIFHLRHQPFNDGNKAEFCSKLAATICEILGIKLPVEAGSVDPSLLDQILSGCGVPHIDLKSGDFK